MKTFPSDSFLFEIIQHEGEKRAKILAPAYYRHFVNSLPLGSKGVMHMTLKKPTRSQNQLSYYFVIVGLIAEYTGYDKEECHDAIMRLHFGTKIVQIGNDKIAVRKSISDRARMTKTDCINLIEFALQKAGELGIVVPTAESLGYISNR